MILQLAIRPGPMINLHSNHFICFKPSPFLDRQYTVFGKVIKGMEFVDLIKRGEGSNGEVSNPDSIISLSAE